MKQEKIIEAWDRVSPDQQQIERMRNTLETRMEGEEVHMERKKSNYDVQRIPGSRRKNRWLPAAAVLVLVLAGVFALAWLTAGMETPSPSMVTPTETGEEAAFQPILEKYITAINEGWDSNRCAQEQISVLTPDVKSLDDLGYVTRDMNGDGQEELLITDGYVIYGMYALVQGEVYQLLTGWDGSSYFLSNGNLIGHITSSSASVTQYDFLSYTERTLFENHGVLRFDGERDPENPWLFQEKPVNEAMAEYILSQRPQIYIRHTPFSGNVVESDTPEDETLLALYAASIPKALENYSKDKPVTFCFYDSDNDGQREMLLGAGKALYSILNISESTGEVQAHKPSFSGDLVECYLCRDGVRKYITYKSDYVMIDFGRRNGMYYETFMSLMYQESAPDPWRRYDWAREPFEETEKTALTVQEVRQVLESYPHLNLNWQPLEDFPVKIPIFPRELFENGFVPIASQATDNHLDTLLLLANAGGWSQYQDQVTIVNPADESSELTAVINGEEGKETIEKLSFTMTVSGTQRTVSVEFTPNGPEYRVYADISGNGVKVETVKELRSFLIQEEKSMRSRKLAEEFANAYFKLDWEAMDKMLTDGLTERKDAKAMGPEVEIEKMTITFPHSGDYSSSGIADVSVAFYEPGVTDSYTYLVFQMVKDQQTGQWSVKSFWLEK